MLNEHSNPYNYGEYSQTIIIPYSLIIDPYIFTRACAHGKKIHCHLARQTMEQRSRSSLLLVLSHAALLYSVENVVVTEYDLAAVQFAGRCTVCQSTSLTPAHINNNYYFTCLFNKKSLHLTRALYGRYTQG